MQIRFSVGEAFDYAFRIFWDNLWLMLLCLLASFGFVLFFWAIVALILILCTGYTLVITNIFFADHVSIATLTALPIPFFIVLFFSTLLFIFLSFGLHAGFIHLMFNLYDEKKGTVSDIFTRFYLGPRIFGGYLLYGLIIVGGIILLIIPGIYWAIRFSLFPYFIVDQEIGITEALRKSYQATKYHWWRIFAVIIILKLLFVVPLVGSILAFSIAPLALVYIYRALTTESPIIPPAIPI